MRSLSWNRAVSVISRSAASAIAVAASASFALLAAASEPRAEELTGLAEVTAGMAPGEWREIPNSSIMPILPSTKAAKVVTDSTGAAFDGRRMYLHGSGGRHGYSGNEFYAFDLATLAWERVTEPSPIGLATIEEPCPQPLDGTPLPARTRDGIVWTPLTGTIFRFLGLGYCKKQNLFLHDTWEFDPLAGAWVQHDDPPYSGFIAKTAVDPQTGHIIYADRYHAYDFDPAQKTYTRKSPRFGYSSSGSLAIDPVRRQAILMDTNGIRTFSLDGSALGVAIAMSLSGDVPPVDSKGRSTIGNWGLAYDSNRDVFVIWGGRHETYTLDPVTGHMTRNLNTDGPGPVLSQTKKFRSGGVFSKWVYVAQHDVFIGYNNPENGVRAYRPVDPILARNESKQVADEPSNQAPLADAGSDLAVFVGDTASLSASRSSDPDGDLLSYSWTLVSGPDGSTGTLSNETAENPTFIPDLRGNYTIELVVSDGFVEGTPDQVMVTAQAQVVEAEPVAEPTSEPASVPTNSDTSSLAAIASQITPGVWIEIPNSSIQQVLITQEEAAPNTWGILGSTGVLRAWNGAAFDGRNMYFHGGGHRAYGGNEVYALDLETVTWSRVTLPSPVGDRGDESCWPYPEDGTPPSSHTYDGFVWSPLTRTIFRFLGADYCVDNPVQHHDLWEFDPSTKLWTQLEDPPANGFIGKTAIDPSTGRIIWAGRNYAFEFDPITKQFLQQSPRYGWSSSGSIEFDPDQRKIILLDREGVRSIAFANGIFGNPENIQLTGDALPTASNGENLAAQWGIAYSKTRKLLVLWGAEREIYTLDAATGEVVRYPNPVGSAPSKGSTQTSAGVYSKWVYVAEHDIFVGYDNFREGIWVYRLPDASQIEAVAVEGELRVCSNDNFTLGCQYTSLSSAIQAAAPGDTIVLAEGIYNQAAVVAVDGITIRGEPGAHLSGVSVEGKAALVIKSDGVVIDGIECSQIAVSDNNGACIRIEAPNLTVRNVYFHDNQEGILGGMEGGTVLIENSVFERNGQGGQAHGVYISKRVDTLVFRNNRILSTKGLGHGLKSRARTSIIENNVIAGLEGNDSRAIDVPNGGDVIIRGNVLEKGPNSDNRDMIGVAREITVSGVHDINNTLIENNRIIFDSINGKILTSSSPGTITMKNNTIVGTTEIGAPIVDGGGNVFFGTRAEAGMPTFPALP